jgi:hypothetical protein
VVDDFGLSCAIWGNEYLSLWRIVCYVMLSYLFFFAHTGNI